MPFILIGLLEQQGIEDNYKYHHMAVLIKEVVLPLRDLPITGTETTGFAVKDRK